MTTPTKASVAAAVKDTIPTANLIFRMMKWMVVVDLLVVVLLSKPDQVLEIYRITAATSLAGSSLLVTYITLIGVAIWMSSRLIAVDVLKQLGSGSRRTELFLQALPVVMGSLPILAAAAGQLAAIPTQPSTSEEMLRVGSIVRIQATELDLNAFRLKFTCWVLVATAVAFALAAWSVSRKTLVLAHHLNQRYFERPITMLVTVALIAALTAMFVASPVTVPQRLTVVGVLCLFIFTLCSFVVHITLITDRYKIAFLPMIVAGAGVLAYAGINDNHLARGSATDVSKGHALRDVSDEFLDWMSRSDRSGYVKARSTSYFPVFVVAAQGGGAYAAHNAAVFLARMQDLCPNFRHHLFAVSAVSGGSIGLAAFAAALAAEDRVPKANLASKVISDGEPCPQITRFLAKERPIADLESPGPIEQRVVKILQADLLSPLVAAALFPDFSQKFIPFPVPPFDRARALEYALEKSASDMIGPDSDGKAQASILERNYFDHWDPKGSSPALLFNATDAGSGKRTVFAPFQLVGSQLFKDEVCMFGDSAETKTAELETVPTSATLFERPIPLSTAAFISARFPWVTPAATVKLKNPCFGSLENVMLVDGGYLDNSGVETAMNLVERLKTVAGSPQARSRGLPSVGVHLISLTGGDFPKRGSYAFSDQMEPIRALLSGRESRAYIALNRAQKALVMDDGPAAGSFDRIDLRNMFYRLPLGWSLSDRTRSMIAHESGRYWDCEPRATFSQSNQTLSRADCVQLQTNFLLKGTLPAALKELEAMQTYRKSFNTTAPPKLDSEAFLQCYEAKNNELKKAEWNKRQSLRTKLSAALAYQNFYLTNFQAEQIRALLLEWDELKEKENDARMLAFIFASLSLDTLEFRRTSEFLSFETEALLTKFWGPKLDSLDRSRAAQTPPLAKIDRSALLNNPKLVAATVWAEGFGNKNADDAWRYRARGLVQPVGLKQYALYSSLIGYSLVDNPDALEDRRAAARVAFAHYLNWKKPKTGQTFGEFIRKDSPDWAGARRINTAFEYGKEDAIAQRSEMVLRCVKSAQAALGSPSGAK